MKKKEMPTTTTTSTTTTAAAAYLIACSENDFVITTNYDHVKHVQSNTSMRTKCLTFRRMKIEVQ